MTAKLPTNVYLSLDGLRNIGGVAGDIDDEVEVAVGVGVFVRSTVEDVWTR
jgi:hypothetical protein